MMRFIALLLMVFSFATALAQGDSCCFQDNCEELSVSAASGCSTDTQDHPQTACMNCVRCTNGYSVPSIQAFELYIPAGTPVLFAYLPDAAPCPDLSGLLRPPIA